MYNLIFIFLSALINLFAGGGVFFAVSYFSTWVLTKLSGEESAGFAALGLVLVAMLFGSIAALLSLFPSYKLSMKLAEVMRARGWGEIRHPRRLFVVALGLLLLPILLPLLFGILKG